MRLLTLILFYCFFLTAALAEERLIVEPDEGRTPLLSAIDEAHRIHLVLYGLTDPLFIDALTHAQKEGKKVRVLLEPSPYRAADQNQKAIRQLLNTHVPLQVPSKDFKLTHQKTLILDEKKAIVMTFNLTRSTFKNERNFALILDDPALVKEINAVFQADWQHQSIHPQEPRLIWSPDNSREKITALIQEAQSSIHIYAQDITDYAIIGALAKASRNGVDVKILTAPFAKMATRKWDFLRKADVKVQISHPLIIHAKVIIIDGKRAMIGSINLTRPSLQDNRELAVITDNPNVIKKLLRLFHQDWDPTPSPLNEKEFRKTLHTFKKVWRVLQRIET